MLSILITGSNGQLGSEIRSLSDRYPRYHFIFTDIPELDITDPGKVDQFMDNHNIDLVINCAAYTAVDKAEDEPDKAMLINGDAVANLVKACKKHEAYLIHISTDYVFSGESENPHEESDPSNPNTSYGRSKLAGEEFMSKCLDRGMIIRTSWLYSGFGSNFVKTILKKGAELGDLMVVDDQTGCPTYARDLASAILEIIPKALSTHRFEIYHYSNEGHCTWYELATAATELAKIPCTVNPVHSEQYPSKAPRPFYSVLDTTKIKEDFGLSIPHWRDSLRVMISNFKF